MLKEPANGYSSAIQFVDPARMRTRRLSGAGLRLGKIGGDELRPVVVARNIGDSTAVISGTLPFTTKDGRIDSLPIRKVWLGAGESVLLPLQPALRRLKPEQVASAGLEFKYKGKPGSVIMSAQSVSASGNQVCHVPMLDPGAQKSSTGGYPWSIEDTSSTAVYIMNATERVQHYTAYLKLPGSDYVIGTKELEAGQTATYDIRGLRDNQAKDRDGRTIPVDAASGQFYWSIIQAESGPTEWYMIGRAEQMDEVRAMSSSYACQNCCNTGVAGYGITPTFAQALPGDEISFSVWQDNFDCNGNVYPSNPIAVSWSSSNNTVAKMHGNAATAKSAGTVTITAQWNNYQTTPPTDPDCGAPNGPVQPNLPDPCACRNTLTHLSASATLVVAKPKIDSISPARGVQGIEYGVTITGTGFRSPASITASGTGITVSEVHVGSTTEIIATFTLAVDASGGNHAITVTVSGQTSNSINFYVQIPKTIRQDSLDPITTCDPTRCTIGIQQNACGAYRSVHYTLVDQANPAQPIAEMANVTETVKDLSVPNDPGTPKSIPTNEAGALNDLLALFKPTTCPSPGESASISQTFIATVGSMTFTLTRVNRIDYMKSMSGQYSITITVQTQ